eukprot:4179634-Amphidinium_carterae.1
MTPNESALESTWRNTPRVHSFFTLCLKPPKNFMCRGWAMLVTSLCTWKKWTLGWFACVRFMTSWIKCWGAQSRSATHGCPCTCALMSSMS